MCVLSLIAILKTSFISRMFSFGEFKQEDQDKMLAALNRKVAEVYGACIGQNEANIRFVFIRCAHKQ